MRVVLENEKKSGIVYDAITSFGDDICWEEVK